MSNQRFGKDFGGNAPENYERYFVPAIGAPLANDLVEVADLRPGERVLDVACGTGIVARLAAQRVGTNGTVVGLDLNPGMLAVARAATPSGMTIQWHEANAEKMMLADASFDVVLCQMGLQFMPDKLAALREMHRILAPSGRLILNAPGPTPPLMEVMGDALARHVGAEAEGFVQHVFSLHDTAELQKFIEEAGFSDVSVQADTRWLRLPAPEAFLWGYVSSTPLAGAVAKVDDERRGSLERDVVARWQEFVENGSMMLKLRMVVATAQKQ
jgi:ubiquinone/menaquinone biosynthesis C-methylase UbiE